ncbi:MAG: glucuronate isomerase [Eubacteriales bacterium]
METFMNDNFLLKTEASRILYHDYASKMPIFDFHNHLSAKEIFEDSNYENIAQAWLDGDHYKWRAMRACGYPEKFMTGKQDDYNRYMAYVKTLEGAIGNPLYHWSHLELKRYFGIDKVLNEANAKEIWDQVNAKLQTKEFSIRNLLVMLNVVKLCTTDDPIDTLEYHKKLKEVENRLEVLPTFRPDRAINIEKADFNDYVALLEEAAGMKITTFADMVAALCERLDFFKEAGCVVTDHSLELNIYEPTCEDCLDAILAKRKEGTMPSDRECSQYRGALLIALGKEYAKRDMVMQIHIGAIRNNSEKLLVAAGENIGADSLQDFNYAPLLNKIMSEMQKEDLLPKTVFYCLNPKDCTMLASIAGNFQEEGVQGKMQFGTAWWFNDHIRGMKEQIEIFATQGVLGTFIGMLTDSRSYLSFPRHEYFRRILCNMIGDWIENGEYPADMEHVGKVVENISYNNAVEYFR